MRGLVPRLQRAEAAAAGCDLNEDLRETLTTFVFVAEALNQRRERFWSGVPFKNRIQSCN